MEKLHLHSEVLQAQDENGKLQLALEAQEKAQRRELEREAVNKKPRSCRHLWASVIAVMCCCLTVFMVAFRTTTGPIYNIYYANKQVGDRFEFGRYPQGPNGEIKPIVWRVLHRDSKSLLVISERALDAKPYNKKKCDITWADCTLRRWLNNEFVKKAFTEQELSLIQTSKINNNVGPSTQDRVFLLSSDEARSLFSGDGDCICKPTDYAVKSGAWVVHPRPKYDGAERNTWKYVGNTYWWLRSRGVDSVSAEYIFADGSCVYSYGYVNKVDVSVRPALRLAI